MKYIKYFNRYDPNPVSSGGGGTDPCAPPPGDYADEYTCLQAGYCKGVARSFLNGKINIQLLQLSKRRYYLYGELVIQYNFSYLSSYSSVSIYHSVSFKKWNITSKHS